MLGPAIVSQTSLNPPNRIKLGFTNIYQTVTPPGSTRTADFNSCSLSWSRHHSFHGSGPFRTVSPSRWRMNMHMMLRQLSGPSTLVGSHPTSAAVAGGVGGWHKDQHLVPVYRTGTSVSSQVTLQDMFKTLHVVSYFWIEFPFFL